MKFVRRSGRLVGWLAGLAPLGLAWIPAGCGNAVPPPPSEAWTIPAAEGSKAAAAPGRSRKASAREEDSRLSGKERRALLKQNKSG